MMYGHDRSSRCSIVIVLLFTIIPFTLATTTADTIILRVRTETGALQRYKVSATQPLSDSLPDCKGLEYQSQRIPTNRSPNDLALPAGALLQRVIQENKKRKTLQQRQPLPDPFPDLAKRDLYRATRRQKRPTSYAHLSTAREALHTVDPQPTAPLQRFHMDATVAEKCTRTTNVLLLLGTVARERISGGKKPRTSLSSTTQDEEYCNVAKVQAYMPVGDDHLISERDEKVLKWAAALGLQPVGWMFRYTEKTRHDQDGLPVWWQEIVTGARLQQKVMMMMMRNEEWKGFATVAMDANTGATEVFQLSDVTVQMVAEDMMRQDENTNGRYALMRHAVVVDGQETTRLDTVLCLVNTALLRNTGVSYTSAKNTIKKNGLLTKTARTSLARALGKNSSDGAAFWPLLANFQTLIAIHNAGMNESDMVQLCQLIRKWTRGQKKGTLLPDNLRKKLVKLVSPTRGAEL